MNTWISSKTSKLVFLVLLGLIFISHIPFIDCDPDRNMSVGRGPFTDEGLNTIQVRNWVNQGVLDLSECDNLLKTPLLGLSLTLTYNVFGTSMAISRFHVLTLVLLGFLLIGLDKKNRPVIIIFSLITLLQYHIFHSSHYSMAEMLSVTSMILSIHFLVSCLDIEFPKNKRFGFAILSAMFLSFSYYFKIQFIYLIAALPIVLALLYFSSNHFIRKKILRPGLIITATLLFFLLLYLFGWYMPNKETYNYMMAHQSGEFTLSGKIWEYIRFNINYHFLKGWTQWMVYFFIILSAIGIYFLRTTHSIRYKTLFLSSLVWFVIELHKITMVYLPARYQVSLFAAMGMLMSVVIAEALTRDKGKYKWIPKASVLAILISIVFINVFQYCNAFQNRTYEIRNANYYLSNSLGKTEIALGAWAPSLTWASKSKALPVWNNFLNYSDPLTTFNPRVIIAETDEQDSEQAWSAQGIDLGEIADSSKTFTIAHWNVVVYWLHK